MARTQRNNQFLDGKNRGLIPAGAKPGVDEGVRGGHQKTPLPTESHAVLRDDLKNCSCLGTLRGLDIYYMLVSEGWHKG